MRLKSKLVCIGLGKVLERIIFTSSLDKSSIFDRVKFIFFLYRGLQHKLYCHKLHVVQYSSGYKPELLYSSIYFFRCETRYYLLTIIGINTTKHASRN